jgi:hypothetical protein
MDPADPAPKARRSTGEWLFQLTTITLGVLIALSFDAVLRWNADRALVAEARATIALEVADNRRKIDSHLVGYGERVAMIDSLLKLLGELDAGVEPTVQEVKLLLGFPSLSDAGWQTAERTGAIALMQYEDVQRYARLYTLQSLFTEAVPPALVVATHVDAILNATMGPAGLPPAVRDDLRSRALELRAYVDLHQQLGSQLAEGYSKLE